MARTLSVVALLSLCSALGNTVSTSSCPSISEAGFTCTALSNCTVLACHGINGDHIINATASITLDSCDDPPMIQMEAHGLLRVNQSFSILLVSHQFKESETVYSGDINVSATVQRNQTSLKFSAFLDTSPRQYLIPPVEYAINTTECLCNSMKELARDLEGHFTHGCTTTEDCDGVRCAVDAFQNPHIMEIFVLSCEQPPAVDLLIEDTVGDSYLSLYINDNTSSIQIIDGSSVYVLPTIIHHPYSMEFSVTLIAAEYHFTLITPHTIILDPSTCHTPPTATPTQPPPPPTLPPNASDPCIRLYNVANTARDPLVCREVASCTSLLCEFTSGNNLYEINIRFLMQESTIKAYVTYTELQSYNSSLWSVAAGNETKQYSVEPQGSSLVVVANATYDALTLQMLLRDAGQQVSVLLPATSVPLLSAGDCLWWVPVLASRHACSYLPDCRGILCVSFIGHIDTASLSLERCGDPISAQLVLTADDGVLFEGNFTESGDFEYGFVSMQRNATQLTFSASAVSGDIAYYLVPEITIPLDPHTCSCQSLEELANITHSPFEHDCRTNEVCDGVRCEVDVLGSTFHLETILLSCEDPPALESVVEDENNTPLYTAVYDETGLYRLQISGLSLPLYVVIEHHNYSMDVAGYLSIPGFGNTTIIPPHKLFLDPTSCRNPPTVLPTSPSSPSSPSRPTSPSSPTTPTTVTPTSPSSPTASSFPTAPPTTPTTATPTCQALLDIEKNTAKKPFMCTARLPTPEGVKDDCDTLECELALQTSNYMVILELNPQGEEYVAAVTVTSGSNTLREVDVKGTQQFSVQLQQDGELLFDFQSQEMALRIQVMLRKGDSTTTLINSTVPLQEKGEDTTSPSSQKSSSNKKVTVAVVVVVVIVCVVAAVVAAVVAVWVVRKRRTRRLQFDFKPMTYSDVSSREGNEYEPVEKTQ